MRYLTTAVLPALMQQRDEGFARVCAYHNKLVPHSKEAAEAFAKFHRLEVSHGICPACALIAQREIAEARQQEQAARLSPIAYAMQRSGV